jgi:hypothetical protein
LSNSFYTDGVQVKFHVLTPAARAARVHRTVTGLKTKKDKKQFVNNDPRLQEIVGRLEAITASDVKHTLNSTSSHRAMGSSSLLPRPA